MEVYDLGHSKHPGMSVCPSHPEGKGHGKEWSGVGSGTGHEPWGAPSAQETTEF